MIEWTDDQRAKLAPWMTDNWRFHCRKRLPLLRPLSTEMAGELGYRSAQLDLELVERRQGKNARQAALIREKKSREGATTSLSSRLLSGTNEIGQEMTPELRADYARRAAALRAEYDAFEEARKAELGVMRKTLASLEEEQKLISKKITAGMGNVSVACVDFADFTAQVVVTVDLERGEEVHTRALPAEEVQAGLFTPPEYPALTAHEYTLAVGGRVHDAARDYRGRHPELCPTEGDARKIIRALLPDEEFPGEDPKPKPKTAPESETPELDDQERDAEDDEDDEDDDDLPPEPDAVGEEDRTEMWDVVIVDRDQRAKAKAPVVKAILAATANYAARPTNKAVALGIDSLPFTVIGRLGRDSADDVARELREIPNVKVEVRAHSVA